MKILTYLKNNVNANFSKVTANHTCRNVKVALLAEIETLTDL